MNKVTVKVLFFAKAKDIYGEREGFLTVDPVIGYVELLQQIITQYSLHNIGDNLILAINEEYPLKDRTLELHPGDIIAVIPPLSGGRP